MTAEEKEIAEFAEMFSRLKPDIQEEFLEIMREMAREDEEKAPESGTASNRN